MDKSEYKLVEPCAEFHPGAMLLEYLESNRWSQADLARKTGLTSITISEICAGKVPITLSTSLTLEKVFHRPAHFWLNLQRQHDEVLAIGKFMNEPNA